jgi:3-oxoacyl-[acyl-carrier protein] reductase
MSLEDYRRVMGVDLDGTFYCCKASLPQMIRQRSGKIITVSSMWGQVGGACEVAYSAAKAGVIGLTKALAKEVGPSGIQVNCVAPGVIDTEMNQSLGPQALAELAEETPLGRLGTAEDVAGCVSYLCSPAADFLTGQVLAPNGGFII